VLFNRGTNGRPVLRNASAHGLGHLLPPYGNDEAPANTSAPVVPLTEVGLERWQRNLWHRVVEATLGGHPDRPWLDDLTGFDRPAVNRYAVTSPGC